MLDLMEAAVMKMLLAVSIALLAVTVADAKEIQLCAGMSREEAVRLLRGIADDMSPYLDVIDQDGKHPKLFCWKLRDYDLAVWLHETADGKVWALGYWTKDEFALSKDVRYDYEKMARRIMLDAGKHTFNIEKFPAYFPTDAIGEGEQASIDQELSDVKEPILLGREKDKDFVALRVLYFSCNRHRSALVRYEAGRKGCRRRSILLYGQSPESTTQIEEVEVPNKELDAAMSALEKIGFRELAKDEHIYVPHPTSDNDYTGTHGTAFVIEAIKGGKYPGAHAVWTMVQNRGTKATSFCAVLFGRLPAGGIVEEAGEVDPRRRDAQPFQTCSISTASSDCGPMPQTLSSTFAAPARPIAAKARPTAGRRDGNSAGRRQSH